MRKYLLLAMLAVGLQASVTAQLKSGSVEPPNRIELPNTVYILDSAQLYKKPAVFHVDQNDCYLQISGDYAVMSYQFRGKQVFFSGTIHNSKMIEIDGKPVKSFTVITDNKYGTSDSGKRMFIGISEEASQTLVYELDNVRVPGVIFTSHIATAQELKALKEQSE